MVRDGSMVIRPAHQANHVKEGPGDNYAKKITIYSKTKKRSKA